MRRKQTDNEPGLSMDDAERITGLQGRSLCADNPSMRCQLGKHISEFRRVPKIEMTVIERKQETRVLVAEEFAANVTLYYLQGWGATWEQATAMALRKAKA